MTKARLLLALALATAVLSPPPAAAQDGQNGPLPPARIQLAPDTDLPGGDLGRIFDTTLQACIQACLAPGESPKYPVISVEDHYKNMFRKTYSM